MNFLLEHFLSFSQSLKKDLRRTRQWKHRVIRSMSTKYGTA